MRYNLNRDKAGEGDALQKAKITIIAGHYGSGKTTVAVNYAIALKRAHESVALCDMDIVNPYFRTADHARLLAGAGVELISSPYANTNVEMPWAPVDALRVFDDPSLTSVVDLGGDDCGALAIGRYAERLQNRGDIALLMVVNPYRPLTRDLDSLCAVRREIEGPRVDIHPLCAVVYPPYDHPLPRFDAAHLHGMGHSPAYHHGAVHPALFDERPRPADLDILGEHRGGVKVMREAALAGGRRRGVGGGEKGFAGEIGGLECGKLEHEGPPYHK